MPRKVLTEEAGKQLKASLEGRMFLQAHPVGSIYMSTSSTSPAAAYGGTWVKLPSMGAFTWKRTA